MESAPPPRVFSVSEMLIEVEDEPEVSKRVTFEAQPTVIIHTPKDIPAQCHNICLQEPDAILASMTNAAIKEEDCEVMFEECIIQIDPENLEQDQQGANRLTDPLKHDQVPKKTYPSLKLVPARKVNTAKKLTKVSKSQVASIFADKEKDCATYPNQDDNSNFKTATEEPSASRRTRKPTQKMAEYICRLCEQNSYKLIKIFGTQGIQLKLADKIHFHLAIQVRASDKLPLGVCSSCINALNVCNDLYQKSLSTDCSLRKIFLNESLVKLQSINSLQSKNNSKTVNSGIPSENKNSEPIEENVETPLAESILPKSKGQKKSGPSATSSLQGVAKDKNVELTKQLDNCSDSVEADAAAENSAGEETWWNESEDKEDSREDLVNVTCDLCPDVFASHGELAKHRKTHPPEERLKCPDCGKVMPNDSSYSAHRKTHTSNVHPCHICGKNLSSTSGLRAHLLIHEEPKFCCQICGKTMRTQGQLQQHMAIHSSERPFSCKICNQSFKLRHTLHQHSLTHNESRKFVCEICGHSVNRRAHLKLHMKSHELGKMRVNYIHCCNECPLKFRSTGALLRHRIRVHRESEVYGEGPLAVECRTCNFKFANPYDYGAHIKECAKIYQCVYCEQVLASKRALENHLRGHTGERPFPCKFCDKFFKSEPSRDSHERLHTGERPFQCSKCDKAFRSITNLYQHKAVHDPDRKFSCSYCQYKTHRSAALRIHLRVHTGEKPYCCATCGKSYKSSWDLKLHSQLHDPSAGPRKRRVRQKPRSKDHSFVMPELSESGDSTDVVGLGENSNLLLSECV